MSTDYSKIEEFISKHVIDGEGTIKHLLLNRIEKDDRGFFYSQRTRGFISNSELSVNYLKNIQHGIDSGEDPTVILNERILVKANFVHHYIKIGISEMFQELIENEA